MSCDIAFVSNLRSCGHTGKYLPERGKEGIPRRLSLNMTRCGGDYSAMMLSRSVLRTQARRLVHTEARILELGHTLPSMPKALGLYVPAVRMGNVIHTAGHIPFGDPTCARTPQTHRHPAVPCLRVNLPVPQRPEDALRGQGGPGLHD